MPRITSELLLRTFVTCPILLVFVTLSLGQVTESDNAELERLQKLEDQFLEIETEFRNHAIATREIGVKYLNASTLDAAFEFAPSFEKMLEEGENIIQKWIPVGIELFDLEKKVRGKASEDTFVFLSKATSHFFEDGQYEQCFQLAKRLCAEKANLQFGEIYLVRSGILTNRFDEQILESIDLNAKLFREDKSLSQIEKALFNNFFDLKKNYENEKKILESEREQKLPQVIFETTTGKFIIELFENEAPETVANFISLVEDGFYDGLVFHLVIDKAAAETGILDEDFQVRSVDYTIYDEHQKPGARKLFAGYVAMLRTGENSSNTKFCVAMAPLPSLDGMHTVFGRVVEGMDSVYRLKKTAEFEEEKQVPIIDAIPSKILSAKVLRKRDHKYVPNKVEKK